MRDALLSALEWQIEAGANEALALEPVDRTAIKAVIRAVKSQPESRRADESLKQAGDPSLARRMTKGGGPAENTPLLGASQAGAEAVKLAQAANTLDELREAIAAFDGLALKKTATNMVFCDGNPKAPIMLVGEAPGADEDRMGKPFVGASGQLLDRILKCIDLDRTQEDPLKSVYISNVLNWRPPGNRTPSPGEIETTLPFIERQIALVNPKILILCGGVAAKALLGSMEGISRLRGKWHDYTPQTQDSGLEGSIPTIATYHPDYLLRTPQQKRAVWQDMLAIQKKQRDLGVF